ncbi:hypothetical protein [Candidatus Spongiihabitans sp.]|uniref:hypothetical protein n=1 Tax=Candidatus Spongiihabitans sp. TaxID=3101308 RepID=UPI003C6F1CE7
MTDNQPIKETKGVVFIRANLSAQIKQEKPKILISYCPELDLYSQGETIKQATENIPVSSATR